MLLKNVGGGPKAVKKLMKMLISPGNQVEIKNLYNYLQTPQLNKMKNKNKITEI